MMNNTKAKNTTEVYIDNKKVEVDEKGEVNKANFKIKTTGQPLLSGIISKPVTVKQEYTGSSLSGSVDEILAALSRQRCKK